MRIILLLSFTLILFQVPGRAEGKQKIHPATFYQRSVAPSLASLILSRSTGKGYVQEAPKEKALELPMLEPLKSVPRPKPKLPTFEPRLLEVNIKPKPSQVVETVISSQLNPTILKRIKAFDPIVKHYSRLHGVDPNLTRAVIYVESAGRADAVSHKGAQGLMQLMPGTAGDMGVKNPMDPKQNIFGGTRYLSGMLEQFGQEDLALWAYNAGPRSVMRKRPPLETRRYIPNVIGIKRLLSKGGI